MKHRIALKITLIYFIAGFLWILFSDKILVKVASSPEFIIHFQTYKGWFFVSFTAFLLYSLIRREITKKNKIESELKNAKIKAEESDLLKSAFLSNMSHEIRTPLNGILGFSELLLDGSFLEEEKKVFAKHLSQSGQNLLKLINDIMDISKIQQNQFEINYKKINLNSLLDVIYLDYEHSGQKSRNNKVDFSLIKGEDDSQVDIITDPVRLTHIFQRLLNNAFFHTTDGFIRFGYIIDNDEYEFFVEDSGTGIDESNFDLIFKPFFKGKNVIVGNNGFGLGLAISSGLAKLLGGELKFTSKLQLGTRFYFRIKKARLNKENSDQYQTQKELVQLKNIRLESFDNHLGQN